MTKVTCGVFVSVSACIFALSVVDTATAYSVSVDSKQNVYGSGLPATPAILGDGLSPAETDFAAGPNQVLQFSSVTGTVNFYNFVHPSTESADGYGPSYEPYLPGQFPTNDLNYPGFNGLSGYRDVNNGASLLGVFLTDAAPAQPAPPTLDFSNNKSFTSLSPLIAQVFFIGDGLTGTGTGTIQQFYVPATATRLFMGFNDSFFFDNVGAISTTFTITTVPEPSTILLLGIGAISLLGHRAHRKR